MPIKVKEISGGKVLEVQVTGKLTHADYQHFVPEFEENIKRHGKLRILFEMIGFHGWSAGALWDDIKVDFKHSSEIERLAIVGEKRWENGMSVFCRPFTSAEVRYFDHTKANEARAWIESKAETPLSHPTTTAVTR